MAEQATNTRDVKAEPNIKVVWRIHQTRKLIMGI